jgi:predicted permease
LRALFRAYAVDEEMDEEIRLHIEMETEELMRTEGLPFEEARRRAMVAFGGVERTRERHREARGVTWIEHRVQDLRYAFRSLRSRPGFSLAVILTLALGIGANTAMFQVVDQLLFRPPPLMPEAGRVHRVYLRSTFRGVTRATSFIPYPRFLDLTRDTHSFSRTSIFASRRIAIGTEDEAREMNVAIVSAAFFGMFDAPPALGRYFTAEEDSPPDGTPVAVLGHAFWEQRYGGSRDVLGKTLQIGAARYTIVGVAPKRFVGVWPEAAPAAFVPAAVYGAEIGARFLAPGTDWWKTYTWTWASMLVERKPGVTIREADADLTQAYVRSYASDRRARGDHTSLPTVARAKPHAIAASVLSDRGPNESSLAKVATWVGGVALIVWLIACANVANLLLSRALQRRREIAVRLALGVSRARLAAQLLTESLVLALLGGVAGLGLAQWGGGPLRSVFLSGSPSVTAASAARDTVIGDPRTLLYAGAAAVVAGLLAGLAPLVRTRHADLTRDLRQGVREGTYQHSWLRGGLLVLQGALSVLLLVGAGLFVKSLANVRAVPMGFDAGHVAEVDLNMRGVKLDSAKSVALLEQLRSTAAAVPGVTHVARQLTTPFQSYWNIDLHVAGIDSVRKLGEFDLNAVGPGYFATMGTRILRGRGIEATDMTGAPQVMVVSQAMARTLWPHGDALGQCVRVGADTTQTCTTVTGIAENIKNGSLDNDPGLYYYLPAAQFAPQQGGLFVRVRGSATEARERIRKALQPVMPGISYVTVTPLSEIVGQQTRSWRAGATMFVLFGLLALVLAVIGLYSVISFNVGQRTHEVGVRVALGATMTDVVRLVVTGGLRLAVAGVVLGTAIALAVGRWVEPLLFQESARDPSVFASVAVALLAVAALASFLPARRAARVDPVQALRTE